MNYYNEIKTKLIENENYTKIKEYSKENHKVKTYFEIGKLLYEAGTKYGENIIGKYAEKLQVEVGKTYNRRTLFRMKQFYNTFNNKKMSPLVSQLTWTNALVIMSLKDTNKMYYYIVQSYKLNLSKRQLQERIKNKEYERLSEYAKQKVDKEEDKTIGIIICKKDNHFIMEYCSDKRILSREYSIEK